MPSAALAAPAGPRVKGHLLRILGVGFGIAVIIGGTIGSGILRTPGEVAGRLHSPSLILTVWLLGGLYAFLGTVSVVELGTMLPVAGGWYIYSRRSMGPYAGFVVGCSDWMMQTVAVSYLAVAFGEFATQLLPQLAGHVKLTGLALLAVLMLLNWIGLRSGSRTQEISSFLKALALVIFIAACFLLKPAGTVLDATPHAALTRAGSLLAALVLALQAVIVTYDGWYQAIYFTEEDKDPTKSLPRSSLAAVFACIAIFLLVNLAFVYVLPMARLSASQMPLADAAAVVLGARGREFILLVSLLTVVSTINAIVLTTPRILFAIGRDGLMPAWLTSVNRGGTPAAALFTGTVVSAILVISGTFDTLIGIASILFVMVYLSGFISIVVLRRREPQLSRPFKAWFYPWGNLLVLLASAAFLVGAVITDLEDALFTLIFVALTVPAYFLMMRLNRAAAAQESQAPTM
ncbi:MAG TPA: APC family permease [Terriglobales bacterium]|nr:APC family permease [Terriglobales bacterium]